MSRSQSRGKIHIGPHKHNPMGKSDQQATKEYIMRVGRRTLIAQGIIMNPATRPEHWMYTWEYEGETGTVYADNAGDARALIKKALGMNKKHRLPPTVEIVRTLNFEYTNAVEQSHENLRALSNANQTSIPDGGRVSGSA